MKKKLTLLVLALSIISFSYAQVGIGNSTPNASAALELTSSTRGFLPPRMTTLERTNITSPAQGLTIFNTSLKCLEVYNGLHWNCEIPKNPTDVYNPTTGKIWMDRNLGASQVAASSTDFNAYGSLFQWGRAADGHQLITWTSATVGTAVNGNVSGPYNSDTPSTALFIVITGLIGPLDWRTDQNNSLWQGVNGINNPCPWGYRLPTAAEWSAELASWTSATASGAFNSKLKLTLAGVRTRDQGSVNDEGVNFNYWSSTVSSTGSILLNITPPADAAIVFSVRAKGSSVRCIKD
jgi:uncharacterized protein (TIGR02145 family)